MRRQRQQRLALQKRQMVHQERDRLLRIAERAQVDDAQPQLERGAGRLGRERQAARQRLGRLGVARNLLARVRPQEQRLEQIGALGSPRQRPPGEDERGLRFVQLVELDAPGLHPRKGAVARLGRAAADPLVEPGQLLRARLAEQPAQPLRHFAAARILLQHVGQVRHRFVLLAQLHREPRRFNQERRHQLLVRTEARLLRQQPHHLRLVAQLLGEPARAADRQERAGIALHRHPVGRARRLGPPVLDQQLGLLQRQRGAGGALFARAAEGEVIDEQLPVLAGAQRLLHQIERDAIVGVQGQRAAQLGDALVALAGGEAILGGVGAQQRGEARILAAAGQLAAQLGLLAAAVGRRGGVAQREQRGHGVEIARLLGEQLPQELGGAANLAGAEGAQAGGDAQRLQLLAAQLGGRGQRLVGRGRFGGATAPVEEPRARREREGGVGLAGQRALVELLGARRIAHAPLRDLGGPGERIGALRAVGQLVRDTARGPRAPREDRPAAAAAGRGGAAPPDRPRPRRARARRRPPRRHGARRSRGARPARRAAPRGGWARP